MAWIAPLTGKLVRAATAPAYRRFLSSMEDPGAAQKRLLCRLIHEAASCEYARQFGLEPGDGIEEFRAKIPPATYEEMRPWIDRAIFRNERGVISPRRIVRVEGTSGSSSGVKWIPYTRPMMDAFTRMFTLWAHDLLRSRYRPKTGRLFLCVTGNAREEAGVLSEKHIGDDRDYLGKRWRHVLRRFVVAPRFSGSEDPLERLGEVLLDESKIEVMSFWSPSLLLSILDHLGINRAEDTRRLWPELQVISCWTAASSALFADRLRALFPDVYLQGKGLLATEAAVTMPIESAGGCAPLLDDVYLEFRSADGDCRGLDELSEGDEYEVLVSTKSGLLRYRLGDRVRVAGFFQKTPLLEFRGRAGIVSDLVGEKMTLEFVERKLAPAVNGYFCLLPSDGGYDLWLDAECQLDRERAESALRQNHQYRSAVLLGQLSPVRVFDAEGLAEKVRRCFEGDEARSGSRAFKPPLLVADRGKAARISRELPRRLRESRV